MVATRECSVLDGTGSGGPLGTGQYFFALQPTGKGGRAWTVETRPWEPGDGLDRFRIPVHPFDGGLRADRIPAVANQMARTFAKANADTSNKGMLLWPPLINALTLTNGNLPFKLVNFGNKLFIVGGRYMYYYDPTTGTATQDKDFGAGKAAVDACVFNNELIVAMGETEKIHKRTSAGAWTQAGDNTFAIALGVSKNLLWRAETTSRISNCSTTPLTLANWSPASPNQFYAGDSTFAVHTIIDYGGVPVVIKGDGCYFPDPNSNFINQVPQMIAWPDTTNGKGAFIAHGSLWVPTTRACYRVRFGTSFAKGPEVTESPGFRWRVRGGVEFGDSIYLLCDDEAVVADSCIVKMQRDTENYSNGLEYRYYQLCSLLTTAVGYCIGVATGGTNPHLCYGVSNNFWYNKLGRGGGRDVDDGNYSFGTVMTLESGIMPMVQDLSQIATPVGVTVALDASRAGESVAISAAVNRLKTADAYTDLLSVAAADGGGGVAAITTSGFAIATRYFEPGVSGEYVEIKVTGALTSATGATRPVVREIWVFGYSHPKVTDIVSIAVIADDNLITNGRHNGLSHADYLRLFKNWQISGTELIWDFEDYDKTASRRFFVRHVQEDEVSVSEGPGGATSVVSVIKVQLARADRAAQYGT